MTKRQRSQGDDLLFSQSELAELDAELAPQPEEEPPPPSQKSAERLQPASVDELVDTAFSDEETAEKKPSLVQDPDLAAGFDGFVEAEPANTDELMAVMAQQEPISSVAAPAPSARGSSSRAGSGKLAVGEIAGARMREQPVTSNLPSVIFDDSPFVAEEPGAAGHPDEIAPQLAALAAAIDAKGPGPLQTSETVLSSSPPPSNNNLQVEVGNEGGGRLRNAQATAIAALAHAVHAPSPAAASGDDDSEPDLTVEPGSDAEPEATTASSSSTPVVSLDDNDFNLLEDTGERLIANTVPVEVVPASATTPSSDPGFDDPAAPAAEEGTTEEQSWTAEPQAESAVVDSDGANIDASWAEAAEGDSGSMVDATPETASEPAAEDGELPSSEADTGELMAAAAADEETSTEAATGPVDAVSPSAISPVTHMESMEDEGEPLPTGEIAIASAATPPQAPPPQPPPPEPVAPVRKAAAAPTLPPPPPAAATASKPAAPPPPPAAATATKPTPAPPPPPASTKPAPAPAPVTPASKSPPPPAPNFGEEQKLRKKRRSKQWFEEIFDEDYLHTLPFMTPQQTEREVAFLLDALELQQGGRVLDIGCGYGRHAMEIAARGHRTVGLDLSLPLLIRATDAARRVGVNVDFVHGDMRDMTFENEFEGAYCYFTTFGYFDDDTNRRVAAGICRALKPGGRLVLDLINRDYLIGDLPTRVWWQGDGCVVLEEVDFNYFTSRLQVQRQIILEDGRQLEQEISIRAYSLHEIGKVLHHAGFRVLEVSGSLDLRGRFYGNESRQLLVVAEKKSEPSAQP